MNYYFESNLVNKKNKLSALALILLASCLLMTPSAYSKQVTENAEASSQNSSAETVKPKKKKRVRRAQTMSTKIYKKLDKVREFVDQQNYSEAEKLLTRLDKTKRNTYEKAMTWNMKAYMYFNQENYAEAAGAYSNIINIENVPESLLQTTLYSLAKLHLIQQDYKSALASMNQWFQVVEKPSAEAYILRAQMHYQLEQFKDALPDIKAALAITKKQGRKPKENWLLIERAVYFQNKDYVAMERCLKNLIALYPNSPSKAQYWTQLAAVYNELDNLDAELATLETAYEQNLLKKEMQLISLAQAMLAKEIPYKAAAVLLKGMDAGTVRENVKSLSLLGDSLMLAKEYSQAISVMTRVAELSSSARDYYKLAQIHTERQEWTLALENVNKVLDSKETESKNPISIQDVRILKGLILFNMNDLVLAKAEFERASEFSKTEKMAKQWLKFIAGEEKRIAFIADNN